MIIKKTFTSLFLFITIICCSQNLEIKRTNHWFFGDSCGIDFSTGIALPVTVGKAMTNLVTATSLMIQDIDSATGATQSLSTMIQEFTGNIDEYSQDIVRFFQDVTKYAKENEKTLTQLEGVIVGVATGKLSKFCMVIIHKTPSAAIHHKFERDAARSFNTVIADCVPSE